MADLIKESGGRWIFMGLESIDPAQPQGSQQGVQQSRGCTGKSWTGWPAGASTPSRRSSSGWTATVQAWRRKRSMRIASWPPGLPVYGLMTPYPATPLYDRLMAQGRLNAPQALAGLPPLPHGLHAGTHQHRSRRARGSAGMDGVVFGLNRRSGRWTRSSIDRSPSGRYCSSRASPSAGFTSAR